MSDNKEINYTCSFGSLCHSSQMLKRNQLKLCSYPFDWIFSNCDMIIDCIQDDFRKFLDKSYYKSYGRSMCKHSFYYPGGLTMFHHRNPLDNPSHYAYYERCVNRFRLLLKAPEPKLFTIFYHNQVNVDELTQKKIIEFNEKLSKYTTNYTILVVFHINNQSIRNHFFTQHENIDFLELHTVSSSNGVDFYDNTENDYLGDLLKSRYQFSLLSLPSI